MMGEAYYNEIDPYAVQWLRNLMDAGEIAPGTIDDRSILDVSPGELFRYDRCHFFAGIAGWDYALQLAGWPSEWPVWTGSCPCQPFSSAGRRGGGADERHLWPAWYWLIRQCRPRIIFGEQVASKDGLKWLDVVFADLEAEGYSCGAVDLCAASVGSPHIRQRLWFVAYTETTKWRRSREKNNYRGRTQKTRGSSPTGELADTRSKGLQELSREWQEHEGLAKGSITNPWANLHWLPCRDGKLRPTGVVADSDSNGRRTRASRNLVNDPMQSTQCGLGERETTKRKDNPGFTGEPRPTQPFIQPLAHGVSDELGFACSEGQTIISPLIQKTYSRVGRLKAYGNAINPFVAKIFIEAVMEILSE